MRVEYGLSLKDAEALDIYSLAFLKPTSEDEVVLNQIIDNNGNYRRRFPGFSFAGIEVPCRIFLPYHICEKTLGVPAHPMELIQLKVQLIRTESIEHGIARLGDNWVFCRFPLDFRHTPCACPNEIETPLQLFHMVRALWGQMSDSFYPKKASNILRQFLD